MRIGNEHGTVDVDGAGIAPAHRLVVAEMILELARVLARPDIEPVHGAHEGHGLIAEELDELWDHVRGNTGRTPAARIEAIQVAVTAIRYAADLTERGPTRFKGPDPRVKPGMRLGVPCSVAGCDHPAIDGSWGVILIAAGELRLPLCEAHLRYVARGDAIMRLGSLESARPA